jgi:hypothetical protein
MRLQEKAAGAVRRRRPQAPAPAVDIGSMPDQRFQLIFDSSQVAASEHDTLKTRLQTRLGWKEADLGRLICGQPVVIRRNLGADQAQRFAKSLEALGAPCRITAQPPHGRSTEPHLSDSLVVCPKCQHRQSPAQECRHCGLIFRKYRPGSPVPAVQIPKPGAAGTGPEALEPAKETAATPPAKPNPVLAYIEAVRTRLEAHLLQRRAKGPHTSPPYLQVVLSQTIRAFVYAAVALVLLVVGIWFARGLWGLYTATQVGERFQAEFPEKAQAIVTMLSQHSLVLPVATILTTLLVCASVATAAQFLHLGRYLYQNRPWWWQLLVWYLPLAVLIGMALENLGLAPSMKLGTALALLPTLCLAPAAFDLGQALICELGDLLARLRALIHLPMLQLRERIASHLDR